MRRVRSENKEGPRNAFFWWILVIFDIYDDGGGNDDSSQWLLLQWSDRRQVWVILLLSARTALCLLSSAIIFIIRHHVPSVLSVSIKYHQKLANGDHLLWCWLLKQMSDVFFFLQSYQDLLHQDWVWSLVLKIYLFALASSLCSLSSFSFLSFLSFIFRHSSDLELRKVFLFKGTPLLNLFAVIIVFFHSFLGDLWNHFHHQK